MKNIPQEQAIKRFQSLPDALKDAIFSDKTSDTISKTSALRDVPNNKIPFVGQLTTRVLLGYLRPENFTAEIQKETGIEGTKAAEVAHDIDTEIFSTVRLELKKLYPPTIQTPTVQAQGFVYQAPQAPAAAVRHAPEPARPYVVPIPEKFRTKSAWGVQQPQKSESQPPAEIPAPTPVTIAEQKPASPPKIDETPRQTTTQEVVAPPVFTPPPQPAKPAGTPLSDIKPIVPLPTFIQSKFKETLKQTTGEKQTTQENPALKSAFTKFTAPHTAAKPAGEKPRESVYREAVPEQQKSQKNPTAGTPQQKTEGKVIDLSGL